MFDDRENVVVQFQRCKTDGSRTTREVSNEQMADLDKRLRTVVESSDERHCYLEFERTHWQIELNFIQLEALMTLLNRKQGDMNTTEQLCQEFKVRQRHRPTIAALPLLEKDLPRRTNRRNRNTPPGTDLDSTTVRSTGEER